MWERGLGVSQQLLHVHIYVYVYVYIGRMHGNSRMEWNFWLMMMMDSSSGSSSSSDGGSSVPPLLSLSLSLLFHER